jgi:hypothetical protein
MEEDNEEEEICPQMTQMDADGREEIREKKN